MFIAKIILLFLSLLWGLNLGIKVAWKNQISFFWHITITAALWTSLIALFLL